MERLAVIDMGSNSFRLVVYDYAAGRWSLTDEIREATRVSAGMGEDALLRPEPMERALRTAGVFAAFCRASAIEDVVAVGTSAIRDARNREELLAAIRERTGIEVGVISGREEAWYGYLAIANSTTLADGFGIDIGGGSVQVMRLSERRLDASESFPLGAVRVSEAFLPGEDAPRKAIKALRRHATETLESTGWWGTEGGRLAGIGGTIRNLAAAAQKRAEVPDIGVQGFRLSRDDLERLIEELASRPASKRGSVRGIKPDRGDVILGGALVLSAAMKLGGYKSLEVTEAGLREGIFFERLLEGRDPPLFEDVRVASVENLSRRFHPEPEHVHHVAELSLQIYDGLAATGLRERDVEERELLWAACMLHDVGVAIDYDDHHRHSQYLIRSAGLPGYTARELVMIALIARYHRKGDPDASELGSLRAKGDERRLAVLAGVIRLAEQLERSRDQSVRAVRVRNDGGHVSIEAKVPAADGDASVAIWAARRNAELLSRAIGETVEVVG